MWAAANKADVIKIVETCYRLDGTDQQWLTAVATAAQPALDDGFGVGAYFFQVDAADQVRCERPIVLGGPALMGHMIMRGTRAMSRDLVRRTYLGAQAHSSVSQSLGLGAELSQHPLTRIVARPYGAGDLMAWKIIEPDGTGINIVAPLRRIAGVDRRRAALWARMATHVAAAWRLRHTLGDRPPLDSAEAIFDAEGHCLHAQGVATSAPARAALWQAALGQRWARGSLRHVSPEQALDLWRGLIEGRWSLIEHCERDGHRYLMCHRNDPTVRDPPALSERERQVLAYAALGHSGKLIHYTLGISPAAVSTHLARGLAKLGLRSRAELPRLLSPAGAPSE